jgi:NitT/TauT family transport system permease protein
MQLLKKPLKGDRRIILGIVGIIVPIVLWELVVLSGLVAGTGVPTPSLIVQEVSVLLQSPSFWVEISFTLQQWMLALALATVLGTVLGLVMGAFDWGYRLFEIPVEVLRPLPSIAVGPILLLVLGAGLLPMALTVMGACLWPILFNTIYGVQSTDRVSLDTARTLRMSPLESLVRVRLPSALPFVFTGIRVAASIGLIVAVSVELLIGNGKGIGGYILLISTSPDSLQQVYAATLIAGIIGLMFAGLLAAVDRFAFAWRKGLAQ